MPKEPKLLFDINITAEYTLSMDVTIRASTNVEAIEKAQAIADDPEGTLGSWRLVNTHHSDVELQAVLFPSELLEQAALKGPDAILAPLKKALGDEE